jgi:hypothetical protein
MDHDMMSIPRDRFSPAEMVRGSSRDAAYIHGEPGDRRRSDFDWLTSIYRLSSGTVAHGRAVLLRSAADAARRARRSLATNARAEFEPNVVGYAADWDAALVEFLNSHSAESAAAVLRSRGRDEGTVERWTEVMQNYMPFLVQHAALFGVEPNV